MKPVVLKSMLDSLNLPREGISQEYRKLIQLILESDPQDLSFMEGQSKILDLFNICPEKLEIILHIIKLKSLPLEHVELYIEKSPLDLLNVYIKAFNNYGYTGIRLEDYNIELYESFNLCSLPIFSSSYKPFGFKMFNVTSLESLENIPRSVASLSLEGNSRLKSIKGCENLMYVYLSKDAFDYLDDDSGLILSQEGFPRMTIRD